MKRLFRYMSDRERSLFQKGGRLENHTDHNRLHGIASTSKGFTYGIGGLEEALKASRYLKGCVVAEWLFIGDADERYFNLTQGRYLDRSKTEGVPTKAIDPYTGERIDANEVYHDEYCREVVRLKYFKNVEFHKVFGLDPLPPYEFILHSTGEIQRDMAAKYYLRYGNAITNRDKAKLELKAQMKEISEKIGNNKVYVVSRNDIVNYDELIQQIANENKFGKVILI